MIKLRYITTALIFNEDKVLLTKQSQNEKIMPDRWALIEGNFEPGEMDNPSKGFFRVIEEETGLTASDIFDLKLRYIVHTREENEIKIRYVFSGLTQKNQIVQSEKSELVWINPRETRNFELKFTAESILGQYFPFNRNEDDVFVGAINNDRGISWFPMKDWEQLRLSPPGYN